MLCANLRLRGDWWAMAERLWHEERGRTPNPPPTLTCLLKALKAYRNSRPPYNLLSLTLLLMTLFNIIFLNIINKRGKTKPGRNKGQQICVRKEKGTIYKVVRLSFYVPNMYISRKNFVVVIYFALSLSGSFAVKYKSTHTYGDWRVRASFRANRGYNRPAP